jgi:hypothetical protein
LVNFAGPTRDLEHLTNLAFEHTKGPSGFVVVSEFGKISAASVRLIRDAASSTTSLGSQE